jgi:hypothetical protein
MRSSVQWPALVLLGASLTAIAQWVRSAPVTDAAPVIDNDEVTVWDVRLGKGDSARVTPHDLDTVIMFLEGGQIRTSTAGGSTSAATRAFGDALFVAKGTDARQTLLSDGGAHEIMIALKDFRVPVVAYRYDGTLKSVAPDGAVVVNAYKAGDIRFNKANRSHFEELATEHQSAVMMELK